MQMVLTFSQKNIKLPVQIVGVICCSFLGIAACPVKYEKFVSLINVVLFLGSAPFYILYLCLSLLFDGACIVLGHRKMILKNTKNCKRLTIRAMLDNKKKLMKRKRKKFSKKVDSVKDRNFMYLTGRVATPYNDYRKTRYFQVVNLLLAGPILVLTMLACGHKVAPISKDRLSPRLKKVVSLNNRQIQFTFSEEIDVQNLKSDNFTIINGEDTLKILTLYPSLSTWEIVAITTLQSDKIYEVSGYVFDKAENKGIFKKSFNGSTKQDTISPWLTQYSKGENNRQFLLKFSEAMDTTFLKFHIIPKKNFIGIWRNYRTCEFVPKTSFDSLNYDTTYYLFIDKGIYDISGNSLDLFITEITPDTIYEPLVLRGKVMNDTLMKIGLAVLKREIVLGIAKVLDGEFMFEVRDSLPYEVVVVVGKYSGSAEVSVGQENSIILKMEECHIDSIIN